MTSERQKYIEIYVAGEVDQLILEWLESICGPLDQPHDAGKSAVYKTDIGPVIVTPDEGDNPFLSIWFNTPRTHWSTDVDCARQAAGDLGRVVRCDPGAEFPHVHPLSDIFLEIKNGHETLFQWEDT